MLVSATGQFEIVYTPLTAPDRVKNVIIMLGDGMGASQRTAARIMLNGYSQGKTNTTADMRDSVVGFYQDAKFPKYTIDTTDGYPETTDVDWLRCQRRS